MLTVFLLTIPKLGVSGLTCMDVKNSRTAVTNRSFNRPTGGVAAVMLFFFLNLNPHHGKPLREHVAEFDFEGLFLIVAGVVCLLLGFNFSESSCQ